VKKLIAVLFSLVLVACSDTVPPTPSPTATPTPAPMATATPTSSPVLPTETRVVQPAPEWHGIPIMPGVIAGEGDDEGYVFTIKATLQQVQEYYQLELARLGWQPLTQDGDVSSIVLTFTNSESATLTVSILSKGDESLVLLVK